jgi:hypothetical protein
MKQLRERKAAVCVRVTGGGLLALISALVEKGNTMREKLIELLKEDFYDEYDFADIADHLIANGVTIPVRCKDCIYNEVGSCSFSQYVTPADYSPNWFCADGERKDND